MNYHWIVERLLLIKSASAICYVLLSTAKHWEQSGVNIYLWRRLSTMHLVLWLCLLFLQSLRHLVAKVDNYNEIPRATFVETVTYKCESHTLYSGTIVECATFCSIPGRPRCFGLVIGHENYCWVCGEDSKGSFTAEGMPQDASFWVHHGGCSS